MTRRSDGIALGLHLCRVVVEAHGERVWAESRGRQGGSVRMKALQFAGTAP